MNIASITTQLFMIPLPDVLTDARHGDHTHFQLVTATVTLEDGSQGTGYTYTGGKGGHAIQAMIKHDLAPAILGRDGTDIHNIWDFLEGHIHSQTIIVPDGGDWVVFCLFYDCETGKIIAFLFQLLSPFQVALGGHATLPKIAHGRRASRARPSQWRSPACCPQHPPAARPWHGG